MALLVAALLLFAAFHFLPGFGNTDLGWHVWPETWDLLWHYPEELAGNPGATVAIASFLTFPLLIMASPFLTNVWMKSRLAWGCAIAFSGLTATGFWVVMLWHDSDRSLGLGGWCLLVAPMLNFAGLLLVPAYVQKPVVALTSDEDKSP